MVRRTLAIVFAVCLGLALSSVAFAAGNGHGQGAAHANAHANKGSTGTTSSTTTGSTKASTKASNTGGSNNAACNKNKPCSSSNTNVAPNPASGACVSNHGMLVSSAHRPAGSPPNKNRTCGGATTGATTGVTTTHAMHSSITTTRHTATTRHVMTGAVLGTAASRAVNSTTKGGVAGSFARATHSKSSHARGGVAGSFAGGAAILPRTGGGQPASGIPAGLFGLGALIALAGVFVRRFATVIR